MASRSELFQSYKFMMQRTVSALVVRETDPMATPLRKQGGAALGSVMIAVLALAAAGVIGVMFPGGDKSWKEAGKVIVEEQTGANFVWIKDNSGEFALHPVPNLASGALLIGTPETIDVDAKSLAGVPRGAMLGLRDLPDAFAAPQSVVGDPWTLCSLPAETIDGRKTPNTALVIGRERTEGISAEETASLVRDIDVGSLHLVWHGRQFPIPNEPAALEGMGWRSVEPIEVGSAWLSALPTGKPLAPVMPPGLGSPSSALPGAKVGEIRIVNPTANPQYYLVRTGDLQQLTHVEAMVTLADPAVRNAAYGGGEPIPVELSAAHANSLPRVPIPAADPADLPLQIPEMTVDQTAATTMCASFYANSPTPTIAAEASVEGAEHSPATPSATQDGVVLANRVQIDGGAGVLVMAQVAPGADSGTLFYVSDQGKRYALASPEVRRSIGLEQVAPLPMPAALVARVPSGSALDPEAVKLPTP